MKTARRVTAAAVLMALKGEVRPLTDWGIVSLSTSCEYDGRHQHEIAWPPRGVVFAGGEVRASGRQRLACDGQL